MITKLIKKHRITKVKRLPSNFSVVVPPEIGRRGLIRTLKSITDLPIHYYTENGVVQNLIHNNIPFIKENISENTSIYEKNYSFMFHIHKIGDRYQTGWDIANPGYEPSNPIITWDEFINGTYGG